MTIIQLISNDHVLYPFSLSIWGQTTLAYQNRLGNARE
jgi:hypothetical protein